MEKYNDQSNCNTNTAASIVSRAKKIAMVKICHSADKGPLQK